MQNAAQAIEAEPGVENPDQIIIRIRGYSFRVSAPFAEGYQLSAGEAQALNNLRAENIQNNLRDIVVKACSRLAEAELLTESELEELQAAFAKYDVNYQFQLKHVPRPRLGDLEAAELEVASELALAQMRQEGVVPSDEELHSAIEHFRTLASVKQAARDRVSLRRKAITETLADL